MILFLAPYFKASCNVQGTWKYWLLHLPKTFSCSFLSEQFLHFVSYFKWVSSQHVDYNVDLFNHVPQVSIFHFPSKWCIFCGLFCFFFSLYLLLLLLLLILLLVLYNLLQFFVVQLLERVSVTFTPFAFCRWVSLFASTVVRADGIVANAVLVTDRGGSTAFINILNENETTL